ncbi:MAG: hypothetical protein ABR579_09475 [Actinomycetota bacterium]
MNYSVTISNEGQSALSNVSATDLVPIELDVVSAAINSNVQATELGQSGNKEDIVWQIGPMAPGETLHLKWTGKVVSLGGFDAVNTVRARGASVSLATTSTTYLAATRITGTTNPPYHSTRRVVTYEAASDAAAAAAGSVVGNAANPSELPFTGFRLTGLVLLAMALGVAGATLWLVAAARRGRYQTARAILPIAGLVVLTACVSSSQRPNAAAPGTPSVKGRHITASPSAAPEKSPNPSHGNQGNGSGPSNGNPSGSGSQTTGPIAGGPAVNPGLPAPAPTVAVVHVVPITAADLPVEQAPTTEGSDSMTYTWNAQGGYISTSTSTRTFGSKDVTVTGHLTDSGGAIHVSLAISNGTSARRVAVKGRIVVAIRGPGLAQRLTSPLIDVTLSPHGAAHARFDYALPSGTYGTNFSFVPAGS